MIKPGELKPGRLYKPTLNQWHIYTFASDESATRFWLGSTSHERNLFDEPGFETVLLRPEEPMLMIKYLDGEMNVHDSLPVGMMHEGLSNWKVVKWLWRDNLCYFPDTYMAAELEEIVI